LKRSSDNGSGRLATHLCVCICRRITGDGPYLTLVLPVKIINHFCYSGAVRRAIERQSPVVALESTIIAHGFPFPVNVALAHNLEQEVLNHGATPATIAIVDGKVWVGLEPAALERLAANGNDFGKAGAADVAVHIARKGCAATTVSATAMIAAQIGISVFATGGIGGVHRGDAADVSHDLLALSQVPLAVVSAGAKAILDLPRTVEALETLGVLVAGYQCEEFPAFYTASSGIRLQHHFDTVGAIAESLHVHWHQLGGKGALICNPIPLEAAMSATLINSSIEQALRHASAAGITGKRLTPFLLATLAAVTDGKSVIANQSLAVNNAKVASKLALALHEIDRNCP
jgi:pseudouridylate synthase